jgi:hypothetical protein
MGKPMSVSNTRIIAVALDELRPPADGFRSLALAEELASRAGARLLVVRIHGKDALSEKNHTIFTNVINTAGNNLPGRIAVRHVEVAHSSLTSMLPGVPGRSPSSAGEAFVATAAGFGAGLLVVATSAELEPLDGMVGGVVSAAGLPTVVVPPGVDHLGSWPFHVVVALDGVPRDGRVAEQISELYDWFNVTLSLLHVLHPGGGRLAGVTALAADRATQMLKR